LRLRRDWNKLKHYKGAEQMKNLMVFGLLFFSILSCTSNSKKQEEIIAIEYNEDELNKIQLLGRLYLSTGGDPAVKAAFDTAKEKYKDYLYG
jgi:hypothetical protein